MAEREHQDSVIEVAVTPNELRTPHLPLQPIGGYSREETEQLLDRAARTLEERTSTLSAQVSDLQAALDEARQRLSEASRREPQSVEQAVGEVLVTAHRAAELVRNEAEQEIDALLGEARAQAQNIVEEAERQAVELNEANARAEEARAKAEEEVRTLRAAAEQDIAALHAEARRVRQVIDEFRNQWWELISDALRQLELGVQSADEPVQGNERLHDDLRSRLAERRTRRSS